MAILYDIDVESGDFTEWTGSAGGGVSGADISVSAAAALAGTNYGIACLVDDDTLSSGYHYPIGNSSGVIRARFYIDPNGLSLPTGYSISVLNVYNASVMTATVRLFYNTSLGFGIQALAYVDAGTTTGPAINYDYMDDGPHMVEFLLTRASTVDANNGVIQAWVDGNSIGAVTDLDNNTRFNLFDWYYFGKISNPGGATGTFYLDQLVIRDDNTLIGAYVASSTAVPVFTSQYRLRRG